MRANLPMGGFKAANAAVGTIATDLATVNQVQTLKTGWADSAGTVDVITVAFSPNITALVDGMRWRFRATGANGSTTPTLKLGTTAAKTIVKGHNQALDAGDISGDNYECEGVYNLSLDKHVLLNPTNTSDLAQLASNNDFTGDNTFDGTVHITGTLTADAAIVRPLVTLTPGASIALDLSTGSNFVVTLGQNSTLLAPTGATDVPGLDFYLRVINTASDWTLDFDAQYKWSNDEIEQVETGSGGQTLYCGFVRSANNILMRRVTMTRHSAISFFREYDLGEYATSNTYTQAHGLVSRHPSLVSVWIECKGGGNVTYSDGDRVSITSFGDAGGSNRIASVKTTITDVVVLTGASLPTLLSSATHNDAVITANRWNVILRIYE